MRNQIFHSPGNEEAELAKIPGDGDPPPPHWDLYLGTAFNLVFEDFDIVKGEFDFVKKIDEQLTNNYLA